MTLRTPAPTPQPAWVMTALCVAGALAFQLGSTAGAAELASQALVIGQAWARATPPNAQTGAAYFSIRNTGDTPERLTAASVPADVAARAELHEHATVNGMMAMRQVAGIDIPAGKTVALRPGGYHLMLVGLKRPLKVGERLALTLRFARAGVMKIEVPVRMTEGEGAEMPMHGPMQMH